jgi:anti-sigma factor RsiW
MRAAVSQRMRRCGGREGAEEDGQILILLLGYVVVALSLVVVAVDITAVHLARTQLLDACDAAALDAADADDTASVYEHGVGAAVPLTDDSVQAAARSYLEQAPPPARMQQVVLDAGTGTPDGVTAVVKLGGRVRLPLLGPVVRAWSGGVTVTVRSQARADIDPP